MKGEEKKQKTTTSESINDMPEDALMHKNGVWYREVAIDGLDDSIKLFNSYKPGRLEGETSMEYKIRRKFLKHKEKNGEAIIYNPFEGGKRGITKGIPYVNENKKDKFKKNK